MVRGVIFDLDGVLVTTDEFHYLSWKEVADAEGIYFDREINHRLRGVSRLISLEIVLERSPRRYTDSEKQALAERKNEIYRKLLNRLGPGDTLPGAIPLIEDLRRAGVRIAIGSSSKNTRYIIDRLELGHLLDAIVDGNDIRQSKPDPEVFLTAAARLGLPPADCVVVEDAEAGLEAARRAGMRVVALGPAVRGLPADLWVENLAAVDCRQLLELPARADRA